MWTTRVTAGCDQHGISYPVFKESLSRANIMLNRKTLANLACWEPYTFKAITDIAKQTANEHGIGLQEQLKPPHLVMKDLRKEK